jgi:hypothetical protein
MGFKNSGDIFYRAITGILQNVVDREGFTADPENVAAVKALALPTSRKETKQALGRFAG